MSVYMKIIQEVFNSYNLSEDDLMTLRKSEGKRIIWSSVTNLGYKGRPIEISQLKEKRGQKFKNSGRKISYKLQRAAAHPNREIWLALIELGDMSLYCPQTVKIARKLLVDTFGNSPRYVKLERADTRNNIIHVHVIVVIDHMFRFPDSASGYVVKYEKLGSREEYKDIGIGHQVDRFVKYMQKTADGRANSRRLDLRMDAYYEWFVDSYNSRKQVQCARRPRLCWSTGLVRL